MYRALPIPKARRNTKSRENEKPLAPRLTRPSTDSDFPPRFQRKTEKFQEISQERTLEVGGTHGRGDRDGKRAFFRVGERWSLAGQSAINVMEGIITVLLWVMLQLIYPLVGYNLKMLYHISITQYLNIILFFGLFLNFLGMSDGRLVVVFTAVVALIQPLSTRGEAGGKEERSHGRTQAASRKKLLEKSRENATSIAMPDFVDTAPSDSASCCVVIGDPNRECVDYGSQSCEDFCKSNGKFCHLEPISNHVTLRDPPSSISNHVTLRDPLSTANDVTLRDPPSSTAKAKFHRLLRKQGVQDSDVAGPKKALKRTSDTSGQVTTQYVQQPGENVIQTLINSNHYFVYGALVLSISLLCACIYCLRNYINKCLLFAEASIATIFFAILIPFKLLWKVFEFVFYYTKEVFLWVFEGLWLCCHPYLRTA
ncbi:hypothetical protein AAMO2058_001083900 [Amorphochlora amoebiformis]